MDLTFLGEFDRVYTYARVSSQTQYEKQTIEVQENRLKSISPSPTLAFRDIQGGDDSDRPGYRSLIDTCTTDAKNGLRVLLVVTEQSRLSREGADSVTGLIELFDVLGITVYALDSGLMTVKDAGQWLAIGNKGLFDAYFLRQHRERLRKGREQRRQEKKPVQPSAPLGYRWTRDNFVQNEQAAIARQLFVNYLPPPFGNGWSLRKCSEWLRGQGISYTPHGVRQLLINPLYRGQLTYLEGGLTREEGKRGVKKRRVVARADLERVISEDEWKLIQRQLEDNQTLARRGTDSKRYPLSGLVWCGQCKRLKMAIDSTTDPTYKRRYDSYRCRDCKQGCSYRIIEQRVIEALCDRATELAAMAAEPGQESMSVEEIEIRRQIEELEAMQRRTKLAALGSAIAELQAKLNAMTTKVSKSNSVDLNELAAVLSDPAEYQHIPDASKRILYHDLVERIEVNRRNIVIKLRF